MVWRGAVVAALALAAQAQAFSVDISNMCDESMTLAHVRPSGVGTQQVAAGATTTVSIDVGSASHVFKWGTGAQATRTFVLGIFFQLLSWRFLLGLMTF